MADLMESWMEVENEDETILVVEWERVPMETNMK
jgi:hypothetical protein